MLHLPETGLNLGCPFCPGEQGSGCSLLFRSARGWGLGGSAGTHVWQSRPRVPPLAHALRPPKARAPATGRSPRAVDRAIRVAAGPPLCRHGQQLEWSHCAIWRSHALDTCRDSRALSCTRRAARLHITICNLYVTLCDGPRYISLRLCRVSCAERRTRTPRSRTYKNADIATCAPHADESCHARACDACGL